MKFIGTDMRGGPVFLKVREYERIMVVRRRRRLLSPWRPTHTVLMLNPGSCEKRIRVQDSIKKVVERLGWCDRSSEVMAI